MSPETSAWYWTLAAVMAGADVVFLLVLARVLPRSLFRGQRWPLALAVAGCWTVLWASAWWSAAWHDSYAYLFPNWVRWAGPFLYTALYVPLSFLLWQLALALRGSPVVSYCLLGGLSSLPANLILIYGFGMLERVPMMRHVSASATLVQGFTEFVLYWCIFASLSLAIRRAIERLLGRV